MTARGLSAVLGLVALGLAAAGCGEAAGPETATSGLAESSARSAPYWLGPSYRGLPLTATLPDTYIYGDCEAKSDSGCAPPYDVQHHASCARNPLSVDVQPRRVFPVRGGAIAAAYNEAMIDVGIGRYTVTVFAYSSARAGRAVHQLRRRSQTAPPSRLPPPAYPKAVLQELKRVAVARERLRRVDAIAHRIGLSRAAVRVRLRIGGLLGNEVLAAVPAPTRPWRTVRRERKIAMFAQTIGGEATADRFGVSRSELRRIIHRVRGLSGRC